MTQRQDDTPTRPTPIAAADLDGFRKDPRDGARFATVRSALRAGGQGELLAEVCELRAPFEPNPSKAADLWAEAARSAPCSARRRRRARPARRVRPRPGPRAGRRPPGRDLPHHRPAGRGRRRPRAELDELTKRAEANPGKAKTDRAGTTRRAARHRTAAALWDQQLGRIDRALAHWQAAWRLEPERTDALAAARALYASLGDDAMVAKLYRAELDVLGDKAPPVGRAKLWLALAKVELRRGDGKAAAAAADRAVRLDAEAAAARELLAEIYGSPAWAATADDPAAGARKASELYGELGRAAFAAGDASAGLGYLRRAVGADPYHAGAATALEAALRAAERWDELDRLLAQRAALAAYAGADDERRALVAQRVELFERQRPDRGQLITALTELASLEPPRGPAATRLRTLLREDQRFAELIAQHERDLAGLGGEPAAQVAELLELATLVRDHGQDKDRAAELLHQALSLDPTNDDALARYVEHFRERRDFRGLCDLYEFSLDNAREAGAATGELVRRLEEIAQICELRLGDVPRAPRRLATDRGARAGWPQGPRGDPSAERSGQAVGATGRGPRGRGRGGGHRRRARRHPAPDRHHLPRAPGRAAAGDRAVRGGPRAAPRR
jgi:tetratricopeptide (TPR) repeat protein